MFVVEIGVVAVPAEKFVVRSEFYDLAAMKHGDHVGIAYGGYTMRNKNRSSILHDFAQMIQDLIFGVGIHAGKRIIENQDPWIANDRAGNGGSLLLSAGKRDAALAHQGLELLGKTSISEAMLAASAAERTS